MIKFVRYTAPATQLTRRIVAELTGYNLAGDWLNGVPTLHTCMYYMQSLVDQAGKNVKYKYHNELKVIQEPNQVYILITGVQTEKEVKLCGFENDK